VTPVFLSLAEELEIHRDQIKQYVGYAGIRDLGLLQSALAMPAAGFLERYLHSDLIEMSAAYLFHIVKNHPFITACNLKRMRLDWRNWYSMLIRAKPE
jgi:death-on-curing protein